MTWKHNATLRGFYRFQQNFSWASLWTVCLCSVWCRSVPFTQFSKCWGDSLHFGKRKKHSQATYYSSRQGLLFHCIFHLHSLLNSSGTIQSHYTLNNLLLSEARLHSGLSEVMTNFLKWQLRWKEVNNHSKGRIEKSMRLSPFGAEF